MPFAGIRLLRNQDHGPWIGVAGKRESVPAALFAGVVLLRREDRASGHRHVRIVEFDPSGIESGIRAEIELRPLDRLQRLLHLLHHLRTAGGRGPFLERFHHDHDIRIFHRHRVGRNLGRSDLGYHVFDLRETLHQGLFRLLR